jgi:nicotinic acetylcholine receptor
VLQVVLGWYEGEQKVDLSDYVPSGTWDVIECPGQLDNTWDPTEQHNRSQITYTLKIRRKTLFYTVNLIIPCVLISLLSVCVFYLPADAGEKMTMCISILLALVVFLLLVSKILPPTSVNIPLIAKYLLFTFIMNIVTILITVIIINWNFRTPRTHRMPRWIRLLFLDWLPRLILMSRPRHMHRYTSSDGRRSTSSSGAAAPVICRSPSTDSSRHQLHQVWDSSDVLLALCDN